MAEAKRKAAAADLAEERNQDTLARALLKSAQDDRLKADALLGSAASTEIESYQKIGALEETRRERDQRAKEAAARQALEEQKYREAPGRAKEQAEFEASLKSQLIRDEAKARRENREPEFREKLFNIANDSKDPRNEMARELLFERRGAGADGRVSLDQITDNALKRYKFAVESGAADTQIKAAAKNPKNPRVLTLKDRYNEIFDEEYAKAKEFYGDNPLKGMGKSSKPSSADAVDMSNPLLSGKP